MKKYPGFTLAEILITMSIVGVVAVLGLMTFRPEDHIKLTEAEYKYAAAYNALDTAAKNSTNPFEEANDDAMFTTLCKGLADYINNQVSNCASDTALTNDVAYLKNEKEDFSVLSPNIQTLNGMNIFISKKQEYEKKNAAGETVFKSPFFLVYVDLNATKSGEHTTAFDPSFKTIPDVFAFAVVPPGRVIPIGLAEYSRALLAMKVLYIETDSSGKKRYAQSDKSSYREAKFRAWGSENPPFNANNQHTYNQYIKQFLKSEATKLYKGLDAAYGSASATQLSQCSSPSDCSIIIALPKEFY